MSVHIVKLCVGVDAVDDLACWQKQRLQDAKREIGQPLLYHATRMVPKRQSELLDGGSIYWVIRGIIQVRQKIIGFENGQGADGRKSCLILLDPELVHVRSTPRRAFQGWRYLEAEDAPPDIGMTLRNDITDIPPAMRRELAELCLL